MDSYTFFGRKGQWKYSVFTTITANPSWSEILAELEYNQTQYSRPDLIAKVFKLKLDQMSHDFKERYVCGVSIGSIYTIEYQKRGLPHAHILVYLHRDVVPRCAEQVDELVRAQVPTNDPELVAVVKSLLIHGPCGPEFPNAPCMRVGKCSEGFPKRFFEQTTMVGNSFPEYARPDNGLRWGNERFMFNNRWVVPYNPYLIKKYEAHINVDIAGAFSSNMTEQQIEMAVQTQSSAFIDWMKYNDAHTDGRDLLYSDFPMHYTYVKNRDWHMRKKGHTIGRLLVAVPRQGENFYLRSLLTVKRGARSYRDLYTVNGIYYATPSAACRAMGLTFDDSEWISLFNEIKDTATVYSLRNQFAVILSNSEVLDPQNIWELFKDHFSDDCLHRISRMGDDLILPPTDWTEEERRYDYALWLLGNCLQDLGLNWERAQLRENRHAWIRQERNPLITEALSYDRDVERDNFMNLQRLFSSGQRAAFDIITNTIDNDLLPNTFFLQGPARTGKTFLYKTL
ncbi:hypothetical protein EPUL_003259 [Erysiphe pulchra]|uniref:Helitron helicase-like domain-containing protein n=1 Tax=Erysiphe pulchra TaxID=225359 RepID=A0A2S4PQG3_9PEZI|nr:hypothetical protein EPUL_003259 [Erysiphe pulchra]